MTRSVDWKTLMREVMAQGWSVRFTKRGHTRCQSPDGKVVIISGGLGGSPSCPRAARNALRDLRRAGLVWE